MTPALAFSLICFALAGAVLCVLPLIRAYRRALEREKAGEDARAFLDAELRRPR